jgi:glycine/D-amino acid oxidase-like deaminating enzyme
MSDILVIGGGIIGLLTARELVQAGAKVTLVEMGETGREASWAGGHHLPPLPVALPGLGDGPGELESAHLPQPLHGAS